MSSRDLLLHDEDEDSPTAYTYTGIEFGIFQVRQFMYEGSRADYDVINGGREVLMDYFYLL